VAPADDGWRLVWSDEFDGPAGTVPDRARWRYEGGDGSVYGNPGWGNQELQHYTDAPENAALDGAGSLAITARYDGTTYTSARLVTRDTFTYGRIETRLRVPRGAGLWPAMWALAANIAEVGWPECGEIDVMEHVCREPRSIFGTIHGPGYSGGEGHGRQLELPQDVADDFHVFRVDWDEDALEWSYDGERYLRATPADLAPNRWVFDHPFSLIVNLAVGGDFGGELGADTRLPQTLLVDHIRVFERS
jgi:beta-glucanase (GH16 family)